MFVCVGAFYCLSIRMTETSFVFCTPGRFSPGDGRANVHRNAKVASDNRKR